MYYLLGYRLIMQSKKESLDLVNEINRQRGNLGLNIHELNHLLGERTAQKVIYYTILI